MATEIVKQWDPLIVMISYMVSALGSYTTLQIVSQTRTTAHAGMLTLQMWLLFASLVFGGCAVWSMHFLGMMALDLGIEVGYEPFLTVLSLVVPVAASHIAFQFLQFYRTGDSPRTCFDRSPATSTENTPDSVEAGEVHVSGTSTPRTYAQGDEPIAIEDDEEGYQLEPKRREQALLISRGNSATVDIEDGPEYGKVARIHHAHKWKWLFSTSRLARNMRQVPFWRIVLGGSFLATGVFAMHYLGMLAMRMNATVEWNWGFIVCSFLIAWVAASASLYIVSFCYLLWQQFVAALIMSLAVCGMHYVGMASATYYPTTGPPVATHGTLILTSDFASVIAIVSTITSFIFFAVASGNTSLVRDRLAKEMELRKTMEKLMLEKEAAVLADRTKSAFVATVSHEIRTPMNIIIGATELLSSTRQNEEQKELTNTIQASSRGLLSMINDILDFSKLNNHSMQLESLGFAPMEVVGDIMSMSAVSVPDDVDLLLRVDSNAKLKVLGDPVRFQQIILNLVSNAIKFTSSGFIFADLYCTEKSANHCKMVIAVEDSGIGIPQDTCEKIFEPFVQADNSYARRFGGTGLGLSVCKQLVELMGGSIQVKSIVEKGSLFLCEFPFKLDSTQASDSHRTISSVKQCFLACRTGRTYEVLSSFLVKWGISVHFAGDDLSQVRDFSRFDLVIIAVELLSKINLETCSKPVIVITNPRKQILEEAEGMPINAVYVRRPVLEDRFYSSILQAIRIGNCSPTSPVKIRNSPHAERNQPQQPNQKKILLVEDNKLVQQIAIRQLNKLDLYVDVAENGQEAVNKVSKSRYFAVFMDCQMPVMDGFEATKQIRQIEKANSLPRTKIIALTAGVSEPLRKECLKAGMDTYITKPVTLLTLKQALCLEDGPAE